ncbi:MAG: hypothetical protein J0L64_21040 [Acidobacteria bacterium]|nr:hypothetical protein [Acidobacteriota bacterium]
MIAAVPYRDSVERAIRRQPQLKTAMAQAQHVAPRIKEVINEITAAMAARTVPRNAVTEEFERKFPALFRAAVVQGMHMPHKPGGLAGGHINSAAGPAMRGHGAKCALASMAEKALFIAALEGAIDEAEESTTFDLATAIGQLTTKLDKLRPEYREDLQELNQMLEVLQNMTQTSHQMKMGVIQNMRP